MTKEVTGYFKEIFNHKVQILNRELKFIFFSFPSSSVFFMVIFFYSPLYFNGIYFSLSSTISPPLTSIVIGNSLLTAD